MDELDNLMDQFMLYVIDRVVTCVDNFGLSLSGKRLIRISWILEIPYPYLHPHHTIHISIHICRIPDFLNPIPYPHFGQIRTSDPFSPVPYVVRVDTWQVRYR